MDRNLSLRWITCPHEASAGVLGITARKGQVLQMALNEQALIPYIVNTLKDSQLALNLASRLGLQGAEGLYMTEFNRLVAANDIQVRCETVGSGDDGSSRAH